MHGQEKSDPAIVARKPTNVAGRPAAEPVERRAGARGERGPAKHAPGSGPDKRVPGAGPRAANLPSTTQGGSRMRECRTYGSVRGAPSNGRPYRDSDRLREERG